MTSTLDHSPTTRVNLSDDVPDIFKAMLRLDSAVASTPLERPLKELVRIRASQINGCAYCIDMHTLDARSIGESEQRIYALSAWHEAPFFTSRERAALALTEAVTLVHDGHVPGDVYARAAAEFDAAELAQLVWLIIVINAWNRMGITARLVAGEYDPAA
ncbi:MAG TPA: carboxymuconolactone decarboxylase family protein [Streptosporangiaceae bacterium]|nr:carboxymuconolactone decarboxylase family protein [Streptosporangiaceae bacterium]